MLSQQAEKLLKELVGECMGRGAVTKSFEFKENSHQEKPTKLALKELENSDNIAIKRRHNNNSEEWIVEIKEKGYMSILNI